MADCLAQVRRCLRTIPERTDFDVPTLGELKRLADDQDSAIRAGVHHARRLGYSWAEIARELGVTKQTAHERWGP
jgi:predicted transcriptional regulator